VIFVIFNNNGIYGGLDKQTFNEIQNNSDPALKYTNLNICYVEISFVLLLLFANILKFASDELDSKYKIRETSRRFRRRFQRLSRRDSRANQISNEVSFERKDQTIDHQYCYKSLR
jgi:hypothetical protein